MEIHKIEADLNHTEQMALCPAGSFGMIPVVYEDNHVIVAVKPPGVLSQSDGSPKPDMLTLLKEYIRIRYSKPGRVFLGLVHRLDCPVGGLMVFARTSKGASRLSAQIREREIEKKYYAVVHQRPPHDKGHLEDYILKTSTNKAVIAENGKMACLDYMLLSYSAEKNRSLLDVDLHTGRTHQIRVQLTQMGNPIVGDCKYIGDLGSDHGIDYTTEISLFSYYLSFKHPTGDYRLEISVIPRYTDPWSDFKDVLKKYRDSNE